MMLSEILDHKGTFLLVQPQGPSKNSSYLQRVKSLSTRLLVNRGFQIALVFLVYAVTTRLIGLYYVREYMGFETRWVDIPTYETFSDYKAFYVAWIDALWNQSWYPYTWGAEPNVLNIYGYTPVFLYTLAPFWWLPEHPIWIPILIGDAAAVVPIVMAAYELRGKYGGILAGSLYSLSVLNIFYEGGVWMNPGVSTFFLMMGVYLWGVKKQYSTGNLFFVLAVMTKQLLIFLVFPFYLALITNQPKRGIKQLIAAIVGCFILACPYIILTPQEFFGHMLGFPSSFDPTITDLGYNHPVRLTHTFAYWLETQLGGDRTSLAIFALLYNSAILFFTGILATAIWAIMQGANDYSREGMLVGISIWTTAVQLLFSRGIYKYYFTAVFPFFAVIFPFVLSPTGRWRSLVLAGLASVVYILSGWYMLVIHRIIYEWVIIYLVTALFVIALVNTMVKRRRGHRALATLKEGEDLKGRPVETHHPSSSDESLD